jgi:UDP-glucose 4,6-dehydratase
METIKNVLITGGCGFIGSNFTNYIVDKHKEINFVMIDIIDYCATLKNLEILDRKNFTFYRLNILNYDEILKILRLHEIDMIVHLAAQTHVDNSFGNSLKFSETNILGTHNLLEVSRIYGRLRRFVHMSTDEVYGEIIEGKNDVGSYLNPTNPYAATKAASEHIVDAYRISYKLPTLIIRMNNVYGPRQYPEKVIPKFISCLLKGEKCPVHGNGTTRRNFIYIDDVVSALELILFKGQTGKIYNIGNDCEYSVMDILAILVDMIKKGDSSLDWADHVSDRNYNDKRYAINDVEIKKLGWKPIYNFDEGMTKTVNWYTQLDQVKTMMSHWTETETQAPRSINL